MNINELDSYNLGDAVKFNDRLNPRIWGADEKMRPEVREQLSKIADDFREFLGIDVEVKDITVSGSNAAYTYTPHSDIDLHLVVDLPRADESEVYRELFDAKKYAYNDMHDIKIGDYDVELYVQDANKPHISQGIYSIVNDDWVSVPKRKKPDINDISVKSKFEDLGRRIESAIKSQDYKKISALADKIKEMRQAGLDSHGEFGPENLAFKILRKQGLIEKLYAARNAAKDELLSLDERRKKKKKKVRYGYGGYWYPGTAYAGQDHPAGTEGGDGGGDGGGESMREDAGMTWDGVNPTTDMFTSEDATMTWDGVNPSTAMFTTETQDQSDEGILKDFIDFCVKELKLKDMPNIKLRRDPQWPKVHKTFGRYQDESRTLEVAWGNRHIMDVLRTVAHELTHKRQHEREDVPPSAGETGSEYENEANARAGILMRDWARLHPEHFEAGQAHDLEESASGYIPTRAQARDPRFSMALTVDIRPGQVGKEANKLKLRTDKQGHPQIARANGLFEDLMAEYQEIKEGIQAPVSKEQRAADDYYRFIVGKIRLNRVLSRQEQEFYKLYNLKKKLAEDEDLDEVKMSPGALEKFAASPAAKGIRAGFEAELIFRDTQGEAEELDPEPNYDADERCYSISQVVEFFANDEYGYGMNERQQNRLMDDLDEKYMEWRDEQIISDFRNDAEDLIRDILLEETPMDQRIHFYLTDSLQMSDKEADAVIKAGADAPRFTNSTAQKDYADENPEYKAYLEAADEVEQELEESVEFSVNRQDEYWDEALDKYRDNYSGDDDSFFSDVGLRWMSDVANEFNLDWPVWDGGGQQNYGSRSWDDIGASLQATVDMPVVVSSNYHSTRRRPGQWIIEPDGSLDPDDKSEEAGLEIVSPPMPLLTAIEKLKAVTDWANDPQGGNAYTNSSTGLHMGVSLPTMKSEGTDSDIGIDYVKLILFLGDKYVQQQFGREANTYCASALDKLKQNIKGKKSDPAGVVELLRHGLTELAQRELQKGVGTSKYTSAHIQPGYIEFRSPGGDWLAKSDEEIGVLENTMLRFARAMAIAGDPSAERQEYAKKLYKLVTTDNEQYADQLRLFSEFSAGTINKEQLKKQWAQATLAKDAPELGQKDQWQLIDRRTRKAVPGGFEYDNFTQDEARERARQRLDLDDQQFDQKYEIVPYNSGKWEIYAYDPDFDTEPQQLEIVDASQRGEAVDKVYDKYNAERIPFKVRPYYGAVETKPEPKLTPRAKLAQRIVKPKPQPKPQQVQAQAPNGVPYWNIVDRDTGHAVHTVADHDRMTAYRQGMTWLRSVGAEPGYEDRFGVEPKMIPDPKTSDAKRDSADLQRSLGVRDVEPNIAQNFEPRRMNYELVSDENPDQVIHRMPNATADEVRAWIDQQEQDGMPPGLLRTRIVAESIDPVSGAGAIPPRQDPKNTSKKTVQPAEKVFKQPVKSGLYKSAIGQAISQKDLENMTHQVQIARKLGDSVMEMEDTPPEVLRALDQAAQKNGYKNWADVKANPRSENAVMTVAKLANTIMRTTPVHHQPEKIFYKSKTDENFADGKVKGKSRPGRVKRAGASCSGSVTDLRARAKKYGGEKGRMYHWCANMKAGRKK